MKISRMITTEYTVRSSRLPASFDGFRMAVLADLHNCRIGEDNSLLLSALAQFRPDAVLAAGDLITEEKRGRRQVFTRDAEALLQRLAADGPVFFGIGNHEKRWKEEEIPGRLSWNEWKGKMEKAGVLFLDNRSVRLHRGGETIRLTGLSLPLDYYKKGRKPPLEAGNIRRLAGAADPAHYQILLAHTPEYGPVYRRWGADLSLAGHFHGGIIRLPGFGGVIDTGWHLFPRYDKGCFRIGGGEMIVSAGLGCHTIPLRVNNPPELVAITLHREREL